MKRLTCIALVVIAVTFAAGCSSGASSGHVPSSASQTSPAVRSDSAEAYRAVIDGLVDSMAYMEFQTAVTDYAGSDPSGRCAEGDFSGLAKDADRLRVLAAELPGYSGDDPTAILAYQHCERYAQLAVSSADAFAAARTVGDVESAARLFGAAYDEQKELTRIVMRLRDGNR